MAHAYLNNSPFFTSSSNSHFPHHNHHMNTYYHDYSATNPSSYYTKKNQYYSDDNYGQEKYFPKQLINILPGASNLPPTDQQKLIHPLQTYTYEKSPSLNTVNSPFYRGQIYYTGAKRSKYSNKVNDNLIQVDPLIMVKKDNPFHKKYLLSHKNQQLQNYAMYNSSYMSSISQKDYLYNDYPRRSNSGNKDSGKFYNSSNYKQQNEQEMGQGMLRLAQKYGEKKNIMSFNENNANDEYVKSKSKEYINTNINIRENNVSKNYYDKRDYQQIEKNYKGQRQRQKYRDYTNLVQSDVDQKEFGSFGKGKQSNKNQYNENQGQSLINGLTKMVFDQRQKERQRRGGQSSEEYISSAILKRGNQLSKQDHQGSKRKPVYIDSDDDSHRSGTFRIPDAIIDEINNPKGHSKIYNGVRLEHSRKTQYERSEKRNNSIYRKSNDYTQTGQFPDKITRKGKTYEKIPI